VIGTAGSADKVAAVSANGADLALSYATDDVVKVVADFTGGGGVDRIVDTAFSQTIAQAPDLLRANGVIATYSSDADANPRIPFHALMYKNIAIRPFAIFGMPREAQDRAFSDITAALAANRLQPRIGQRMSFDRMIEAHALMEARDVWGCLVVDVAD